MNLISDWHFANFSVFLVLVITLPGALGQWLISGDPGCVAFPLKGPVLFGCDIFFLRGVAKVI